jgi:hypothetical protein
MLYAAQVSFSWINNSWSTIKSWRYSAILVPYHKDWKTGFKVAYEVFWWPHTSVTATVLAALYRAAALVKITGLFIPQFLWTDRVGAAMTLLDMYSTGSRFETWLGRRLS